VVEKKPSKYYRALLLDYPNAEDRARHEENRRRGIRHKGGLGGLIEIHGMGGQGKDWTRGCVAVTNQEMDRLWDLVSTGAPVTIVGSDGSSSPLVEVCSRYQALFPEEKDEGIVSAR
jgi:murein L,D-transpeptidase YafK